jgi:hypothetical protein
MGRRGSSPCVRVGVTMVGAAKATRPAAPVFRGTGSRLSRLKKNADVAMLHGAGKKIVSKRELAARAAHFLRVQRQAKVAIWWRGGTITTAEALE